MELSLLKCLSLLPRHGVPTAYFPFSPTSLAPGRHSNSTSEILHIFLIPYLTRRQTIGKTRQKIIIIIIKKKKHFYVFQINTYQWYLVVTDFAYLWMGLCLVWWVELTTLVLFCDSYSYLFCFVLFSFGKGGKKLSHKNLWKTLN